MYFDSRIKGKQGLLWFDVRTDWEKSSDDYFEKLDELAQRLDGLDNELDLYTNLNLYDFDSGYEYVYGRIKELKEYIDQNGFADESDSVDFYGIREDLRDIYEECLDLYDSALLYDNYCGPDPEDPEDDALDDEDSDDYWDEDDDWDGEEEDNEDRNSGEDRDF